ncbi:1-acyl-sn-glycerol-3-phosphate acyltransferase [Deinococcus maricopensis]|uniref:Phospholipid/glycerol acyltransferase n=1 Tax=Deinococcus maricopensis (strain DSM 21211 / LMG 22137 / NRRL B-23946 / LB-34) TaxID=709986 RepID=E8U3M3_DEIML|nr:1-acyl-sn-glycerol-3-phosphate acyltransferase [Deinococcus maricopensis]ADV68647.1 phospholipid/glycerol acyltransferase [Deinococcus maricopensis DSM 21211]
MTQPLWRNRPPTFASRIAGAVLRAAGWTVLLEQPPGPKVVSVVYPHTSNWDFPIGILWAWATRSPVKFVAKHSLFRPPFGGVLRAMGGVSVDRRRAGGNFVQAVADMIRDQKEIMLVVAPEGTRARADHWKSGFYYMAVKADVSIAMTVLDWGRREIGTVGYIRPTGNVHADYEKFRVCLDGRRGRKPENETPIRPREEPTGT